MIGLVDRERVDAELYDDYETVKAREVCLIFISLHWLFHPNIWYPWLNCMVGWYIFLTCYGNGFDGMILVNVKNSLQMQSNAAQDSVSLKHHMFMCRNDWLKKLVLRKYKQRMLPWERKWKRLLLQRVSRVEVRLHFTELHARCALFLPHILLLCPIDMDFAFMFIFRGWGWGSLFELVLFQSA